MPTAHGAAAARAERYAGLPVYSLREVLSRVALPPDSPLRDLDDVSGKWRCVIVPRLPDGCDDADVLAVLDAGVPVQLGPEHAAEAHRLCGDDGIDFVTNARWNRFARPQIAVCNGWAEPGTMLETSRYHVLVDSFADVLSDEAHAPAAMDVLLPDEAAPDDEHVVAVDAAASRVRELQYFHRDTATPDAALPALGTALRWPRLFADGVTCDVATCVSRRGARRSWRLKDSGELLLQAALPLRPSHATPRATDAALDEMDRALYGDAGPTAGARLYVYGARGSYDWFIHDDEAIMTGRVTQLDLFHARDETLPTNTALLPVLAVAVLVAGAGPLLVPPNLPFLSVALRDCVVVEQRRVCNWWLDEVSYFLHRCARWTTSPHLYSYLEEELQDERYVATRVIPALLRLYDAHETEYTPHGERLCRRAVSSLLAIALNEAHFALAADSRAALRRLVLEERVSMVRRAAGTGALAETLQAYWSFTRAWPKPGCVLRVPDLPCTPLGEAWYIPVVYSGSRAVFGTERRTVQETAAEYNGMRAVQHKPRELATYLRTRKSAADAVLDELF